MNLGTKELLVAMPLLLVASTLVVMASFPATSLPKTGFFAPMRCQANVISFNAAVTACASAQKALDDRRGSAMTTDV